MPNSEVIALFIDYLLSERRYSPLTVRNYRHDVLSFCAWGEASAESEFSLLEARTEDIREWIVFLSDERDERGRRLRSVASVNRAVASIRSLYKFLRRKRIIERDILVGLSLPRAPRRLPAYVPESRMTDVVERIFSDLDSADYRTARDAMLVFLIYASGVRLAEVVGIDVEDFEDDFRLLRVLGKGDKERMVPLVERLRTEVKRYIERFLADKICKKAKNALFLSMRGERISRSDVQRSVARLLRECGVQGKLSPHVLRHTFATHLLNDGADMREIQELLGHQSLRATQVYTHNDIARLQRAYVASHPREQQ
ncbi:MAG: tyrosine-type recombinase/integrase [Alistipes sp.]|nr:tyrosine-type recombinase/integrase [Alistipes sp.]